MSRLDEGGIILPGGALSRWGGRAPETPREAEYGRAITTHALNRSRMVDAAKADGEARKEYVKAIAEHGPCNAIVDAARRRWDAARARTLEAAAKLEAATLRIQRAADAWAAEVAAQAYARPVQADAVEDVGGIW
ncbi:hypothetical protein [Myxococcus stipitatus]|uniref:hypothetical protein n=1 Tax=Myxococcus stipitatus TaxID=83455 RepID=UPI0030D2113D